MFTSALTSRPPYVAPTPSKPRERNVGTWVMIGVPALLALLFVWQLVSGLLHVETVAHNPVSVSRVRLESDPLGARIDMLVANRAGQETTLTGDVSVKLREPDGVVWQSTRHVTPVDFTPLPSGGFLAGRVGYSMVIPTTDWPRAPRRGGAASVSVSVVPTDGPPFSTVAEERFP